VAAGKPIRGVTVRSRAAIAAPGDFFAMHLRISLLAGVAGLALAAPAHAQFAPGPNPVVGTVGAQTLSGGTGEVDPTGTITIGGSTVAVSITGSATLNNAGLIDQTGSGRAIDSNTAGATIIIDNSGIIRAVSSDAMRVNKASSSVTLTNSGTIEVTSGGQAIDWASISTGTNKLTNQSTGSITTVGEDAIRPGQNGEVINHGTITATPTVSAGSVSGSDGIDLRTEKTVTVTNSGTITGRHGIATDGANVGPSLLTVDNLAGGTIQALNGSGLNVDGVNTTVQAVVTNAFGATIQGGVLAGATNGDGDGIDIDGVLTLTNAGNVFGRGAKGTGSDGGNNNAEGIAAGGGSITNTITGQIIGFSTAPNADTTRIGRGILVDDSSGGAAVAETSIDNAGLIRGETGAAVVIVGGFADSVVNSGTLQGSGTEAAVQSGDGADVVTNSGIITTTADVAVDLGGGNDSLLILGVAAAVTGDLDGGAGFDTLVFDLTVAGSFGYADEILNFEQVFLAAGTVTLDQVYAGAETLVNGGTLRFSGDQSGNADFLNLVGDARVNGHTAGFVVADGYTVLTQVPEPATLALFGVGLLGLAAARRRMAW
jgi:hypothetical protein